MRTTVTFDDDVAAAIDAARRERSLGLSEAVNELIRRGLVAAQPTKPFRQRTQPMDARLDLVNVWEAIETLEGPLAR